MQSHPSWVCGLKLIKIKINLWLIKVTPFVGVWIETTRYRLQHNAQRVTPFVGVWIETYRDDPNYSPFSVTPFVGVWIETLVCNYFC